jgi:2-keto-3-deoxy-6-phosphogluconate aldolase
MRSKSEIIQRLKATGVVAVIQAESAAALIDVGRALREGGVKFLRSP